MEIYLHLEGGRIFIQGYCCLHNSNSIMIEWVESRDSDMNGPIPDFHIILRNVYNGQWIQQHSSLGKRTNLSLLLEESVNNILVFSFPL